MEPRKALFTDLDDTMYSWVGFFAPSFRAMIHVTQKVTKIDEETLYDSFKKVYKRHNSLEYSFVIQELDIWEKLGWNTQRVLEEVVKPARGAVRRVRKKHYALFSGVRDTLKWLRNQNIQVFAITNAPGYIAHKRLRVLQVDTYIDCLVFFKDYYVPQDVPDDVRKKVDKEKSSVKLVREFDISEAKPDPKALRKLIAEFNLDIKKTYLIGDSLENDIYLAQKAGIIDIWAKYGKENLLQKDLETIGKISTFSEEEKNENIILRQSIKPTFTVNSFDEIRSIIGDQLAFNFYDDSLQKK